MRLKLKIFIINKILIWDIIPCIGDTIWPDDWELTSFEVSVWDNDGKFVTQDLYPGHENDVIGWLSKDDINDLILKLETQKAWIPEI